MLKKGERICPVCGKKLVLTPPNMTTPGNDQPVSRLRTTWMLRPYTVYHHDKYIIQTVKGRHGTRPFFVKPELVERNLQRDGYSLYYNGNVMHCRECKARLSLNFNFMPLFDGLFLVMLFLGLAVFFSWVILVIWLGLWALLIAGRIVCGSYVKRNLSNFVPVTDHDALIIPSTELALSPEGLPEKWLHESNIFTTELNRQKYQLYLAKKEEKQLRFSVCGVNGEQKRFVELMKRNGITRLALTFEGKDAGAAQVLSCEIPPEDEEEQNGLEIQG